MASDMTAAMSKPGEKGVASVDAALATKAKIDKTLNHIWEGQVTKGHITVDGCSFIPAQRKTHELCYPDISEEEENVGASKKTTWCQCQAPSLGCERSVVMKVSSDEMIKIQ